MQDVRHSRIHWRGLVAAALLIAPALVHADWDPLNGQWGKVDDTDIRVMTWNVRDTIRSGITKTEGYTPWAAVAHIIASVQPDILILQEAGDNGSYGGVDTEAEMILVMQMLIEGGLDTFNGGTVITSYVQLYAPNYDLPYVFPSSVTDGYNRNVICSRFPFADLNGDGISELSNLPRFQAHLYQIGGVGGGERGFAFGEIDLPDETYLGDLVVGNCHMKAYSQYWPERQEAAQRIAYYIDFFYNGGGFGVCDPYDKILSADAPEILDDFTPIVWGGDWNEDEYTNGRRGPADWMTQAEFDDNSGGTDGTDRDRTDATYDYSARPHATSNHSTYSASKLDYIAWQDNIAVLRHSFVFDTGSIDTEDMPPELASMTRPYNASSLASDHDAVVADFQMPLIVQATIASATPEDGVVDARNWSDQCHGLGEAGQPITVCLDVAATGLCDFFHLCETAEDALCGPNDIVDCVDLGAGCYELTLAHGITAPAATTISYHSFDHVTYYHHPGNVDGSALANLTDITEIINRVNTVQGGGTVPAHEADLDHSGLINLNDVLEEIDLINGGWFGTSLPDPAGCP